MQDITPQQRRKIDKIVKLREEGLPAFLEYLFEVDDRLDDEISGLKDVMERVKGDKGEDGKDYVLTEDDREEIIHALRSTIDDEKIVQEVLSLVNVDYNKIAQEASKLVKPTPAETVDYQKIKSDVLKEVVIPTPKNGNDGKDGKDADEKIIVAEVVKDMEKNLPQFGEAFRDGLELLQDNERLDKKAIKGLKEYDDEIATLQNRTQLLVQLTSGLDRRIGAGNSGGGGSSSPENGSVSRTGDYITTITKGSTVWTITRTSNYISSFTNGTNTWTVVRDGNNRISSWSVV